MIETVTAAVALVAPYLGKAGEEAAKAVGKAGGEAAVKALAWMRDKFTGRAPLALALTEQPASEGSKLMLQEELTRLLTAEPALLGELKQLLPAEPGSTGGQTATASGNSTIAQMDRSSGSSISIHR